MQILKITYLNTAYKSRRKKEEYLPFIMDESLEKDQDLLEVNWLTNWEDQCVRETENDTAVEDRIQMENEQSAQKLWLSFQNSATAIAQLYRGKT